MTRFEQEQHAQEWALDDAMRQRRRERADREESRIRALPNYDPPWRVPAGKRKAAPKSGLSGERSR
ncbi:MAG TPA: hypothetical protein VGM18_14030 [Candidatus Sulfotelmatobacter sp.]|jgi:hypothetical protein